jgi:hypothetical protein
LGGGAGGGGGRGGGPGGGPGPGGEMTQALYAHMNNKAIKKKEKKCILIVQGSFTCIYHALIKLVTPCPLLLTHSLSPYSPNIQQLIGILVFLCVFHLYSHNN